MSTSKMPDFISLNGIDYYPDPLTQNRGLFAALMMQSLIQNYGNGDAKKCAEYAVEFADALIEQLNQSEGDNETK